jgi:hypothetical protein
VSTTTAEHALLSPTWRTAHGWSSASATCAPRRGGPSTIGARAATRGGSGDRLVQVFSDDRDRSYLADAEYLPAMAWLLVWIEAPAPLAGTVDAEVSDLADGKEA